MVWRAPWLRRGSVARGVCAVVKACLSPVTVKRPRGAEKQAAKPGRGPSPSSFHAHSSAWSVKRRNTLWDAAVTYGYELSMWQGRVRVRLSVPCSFEECPRSTRSSGTSPKPESKYRLSGRSDTERPRTGADTCAHLAHSALQLVCHEPQSLEQKENYTLRRWKPSRPAGFTWAAAWPSPSSRKSVSVATRGQVKVLTFHVAANERWLTEQQLKCTLRKWQANLELELFLIINKKLLGKLSILHHTR